MANRINRRSELKAASNSSPKLTAQEELYSLEALRKSTFKPGDILTLTPDEEIDFLAATEYSLASGSVTAEEVQNWLRDVRREFSRQQSSEFFDSQKRQLIGTVADRFYLGGITASCDKKGGPVDTIEGVRRGDGKESVFATDSERLRYENRPEYDSHKYHSHDAYITKNREVRDAKVDGSLRDPYTGKKLDTNTKVDLDHTIPAKEISDDPRVVLAEVDPVELANARSNLNPTARGINRSKGARSAESYVAKLRSQAQSRKARVKELEAKSSLSDQEHKELSLHKDKLSLAEQELLSIDKKARRDYESKINSTYYKSKKFVTSVTKASSKEAAKMGFRQIVAAFLTEAIAAIFDEIKDYFKSERSPETSWWRDIKDRLMRVVNRVVRKWKEALKAGLTGAISGFFSSIVTILVNTFVTTAKNIVKLIREGFLSIIRAIKFFMNPPEGMTRAELLHEVGVIVVGALVLSVGILLEEAIDKTPAMVAIRSIPIAGEIIADVVYGLGVGLATALALFGWDKLDIFGYKKDMEQEYIDGLLNDEAKIIQSEQTAWLEKINKSDRRRYELLMAELYPI